MNFWKISVFSKKYEIASLHYDKEKVIKLTINLTKGVGGEIFYKNGEEQPKGRDSVKKSENA